MEKSELTLNQHEILYDLKKLRMPGMAEEAERIFSENRSSLGFEEYLLRLLKSERLSRQNKKTSRLLKEAHLKIPQAVINERMEDPARNIDMNLVRKLSGCQWINEGRNVIITGQTGTGKTWLACALGAAAVNHGYKVRYYKASRLTEELQNCEKADTLNEKLNSLNRLDLLIIDDFGMMELDFRKCRALFEILDSREGSRSVITVSQIPPAEWYDLFENSTFADACLDRLIRPSEHLDLKGDSLRGLISPESACV